MLKEAKNNKFKLAALIFVIVAFLFLLFVLFLYTPWFKNSQYYKIYKMQKTLDSLPAASAQHSILENYIGCLKSGQSVCQYQGSSFKAPTL